LIQFAFVALAAPTEIEKTFLPFSPARNFGSLIKDYYKPTSLNVDKEGKDEKDAPWQAGERRQERQQTSPAPTYRVVMLNFDRLNNTKIVCKDEEMQKSDKEEQSEDNLEALLNGREWKKNFASVECGAKIIKDSDNMKHAQNIINKNNDEYLLYECKLETFFVIELCETIKVIRFELDNNELYSGTPENFTVRTTDKYSDNLNDWIFIGNFEASSEKYKAQNFSGLQIKSFGKFIRVDVNSYHGTEHFCTLTSFRVFGITEYEYLSLTDEDDTNDEDEQKIDIHEKNALDTSSSINRRLLEMDISMDGTEIESAEQTKTVNYKYIFLQMRNDICVDKVEIGSYTTKEKIMKNQDSFESIEMGSFQKKESEQKLPVLSQQNDSNAPKESVLVQISNRVKILERNLTNQNSNLNRLNISSKQQSGDIDKILETVIKAKEIFKEKAGDSEHLKTKMNALNSKVTSFEKNMSAQEDALKVAVGISGFLSFLCFSLVTFICCRGSSEPKRQTQQQEPADQMKEIVSEADETLKPLKQKISTQVQTEPSIIKKVTFSDDEDNRNKAETLDISDRLNDFKRIRKKEPKEPRRRVTWCAGTFRKLADEAKQLTKDL